MEQLRKTLNSVTLVGFLCLVLAPLACQVREAGNVSPQALEGAFHWSAKAQVVDDEKMPYVALVTWTPPIAAKITAQSYNEKTEKWELDEPVSYNANLGKALVPINWRWDRNRFRFAIEVQDYGINTTEASELREFQTYPCGEVNHQDGIFMEKDGRWGRQVVANIERSFGGLGVQRDPDLRYVDPANALSFQGGKYDAVADLLIFKDKAKIRFSNRIEQRSNLVDNRSKEQQWNERFEFSLKAGEMKGNLDVEIGPFDPNGPTPHIFIEAAKRDAFTFNLKAVGDQHPNQKVLVRFEKVTFTLRDGNLVPYLD